MKSLAFKASATVLGSFTALPSDQSPIASFGVLTTSTWGMASIALHMVTRALYLVVSVSGLTTIRTSSPGFTFLNSRLHFAISLNKVSLSNGIGLQLVSTGPVGPKSLCRLWICRV